MKIKSLINGLNTSAGKLAAGEVASIPDAEAEMIMGLDGADRIEVVKGKKRAVK